MILGKKLVTFALVGLIPPCSVSKLAVTPYINGDSTLTSDVSPPRVHPAQFLPLYRFKSLPHGGFASNTASDALHRSDTRRCVHGVPNGIPVSRRKHNLDGFSADLKHAAHHGTGNIFGRMLEDPPGI